MHDIAEQDIIELLSQVAEIKTRLRQIETARRVSSDAADPQGGGPSAAAIARTRKHLEMALETLGAPAWGFASTSASSLKITGFHTPDIYKALKDIRSRKRGNTSESVAAEADASEESSKNDSNQRRSPSGRRKADRVAQPWASASKRGKKGKKSSKPKAPKEPAKEIEPETTPAPNEINAEQAASIDSALAETLPEGSAAATEQTDNSSVWVQHRVDEIQRALTAAFGDDEFLSEEEPAPKPLAAPEFIGNTDALSVPELIGFFQLQGKTGVLTVDARHEQFSLEYLRGELIHAGSTSSPDGQRLGEVLVKLGHLTQAKLERLLAGKSAAERLGDALRRGEVVPEEALAEALQYQIQNIFYRLFDLGGCRFTFREGLEGEPKARVRYNVTRLLLETARHRDELEGESERRAG
jgi:hypothetical protein